MAALIDEKGYLSFADLMESFPRVSEMTLRKDLKYLDETGRIIRVHGGARSLQNVLKGDAPLTERMSVNILQKRLIAQKATSLLSPGASVFLDSGSTMFEFAKVFPDIPGTVFCGGLNNLMELSRLHQPDLYVLGGALNKPSKSVRDAGLSQWMKDIHFDLAFIAVNGYTREQGFNCISAARWEFEKAVLARSSKIIVLMDSGKVGKSNPFSICRPQNIDVLVSDDGLPQDMRDQFLELSVPVL